MQRTLVLLKPDSVQRSLLGRIISRFEDKGFVVQGCKMMQLSEDILREHYAHIVDKPFFPGILDFMMSTPVVALCLASEKDTVAQVRKILGATNCHEAENGTIRSDFGNSIGCNMVHASDTEENAIIELERFFATDELFHYQKVTHDYVFGS